MKLAVLRASLLLLLLCAPLAAPRAAFADPASERAASAALDRVRSSPIALRRFMAAMPKGADLHNHASGAVYAERIIDWAVHDGLCVDATYTLDACAAGATPLADKLKESGYRDRFIDAVSMRAFVPGEESGHDHFFTSFDKVGAATSAHRAENVAEAARQAAHDRVDVLETMLSFGNAQPPPRLADATKGVAFDADFDKLRASLLANGFEAAVAGAQRDVAALDAGRASALRCDAPPARRDPACAVHVRYIQQVVRALDPVTVFAQTMLGFELARRDPRVVGVNYVAPEDGPVAVRDYALHMRIVAYMRRTIGDVPVSLHAGELTLGLVPPDVLDDHIAQAVDVAGARRIGHGVDIGYERDAEATLTTMARRRVLVEIALTSNDVILGVRGRAHPITTYLRAGVPVALVTDDEGVSRIDLTNEFVRAARDYAFSYAVFKRFVRNSVEYAFAGGASLWADEASGRPVAACARLPATAACRTFLAANERARLEWHVERELDAFEARLRT